MSTKNIDTVQVEKKQPQNDRSRECSPKKQIIGDYQTAPLYMKDNEHITHGYRINFNSPKRILRSLFMLHNESVNIWTHFVPAIIICIVIISFAMIVDHNELINNFNKYQSELSNSFEHYTQALDNLTLIEDMKNMKEKTQFELQQLKRNAMQSFNSFTSKMNSMQNFTSFLNITDLKQSFQLNFQQNFKKLKMMKKDYETIIAPALINQLNSLNNSYITKIKQQVTSFKLQIDSQGYSYLDLLHNTPNPLQISKWPLMVFLGSALVCLLCSTLFHLFYPMSSASYKVFSRFDYAGISILIAGSAFPALYYGMYCYLDVALVYLITQMTLAIGIFILSVFEWMHRPEHTHFKAFIYGGFGLFNIFPLSHLIINDYFFDNGDQFSFIWSMPYYLLVGASYLLGLYIYTIRCPERHYPGKFNLCGHSHQIWHLFVVMGVIFTYLGSVQNFEMRKIHSCPVI